MTTALERIAQETQRLGYRPDAIVRNYAFSALSASDKPDTKRAPLAVFTQTPPSYRSAAFGAALANGDDPAAVVRTFRDLGAPLFFVVKGETVSIWQVYADGPPRLLERGPLDSLRRIFEARKTVWGPDAIHRAKSIGRFNPAYQLDFVDIGLMPAIEGAIHQKLDRLLSEALAVTRKTGTTRNDKALFQGVFRLMAAKILTDREHSACKSWDGNNVQSVLDGIGNYYGLPAGFAVGTAKDSLAPAWSVLCSGLNVSNISADDLAFVYENTLVTPETRKTYGTHSTPRHVAEYVVGRLDLCRDTAAFPNVYEPFAGAGVFLVSALRHLREGLPHDWTDRQRHDLLVKKIKGSEIDAFACEVAVLSLILADYPNKNGWKIENIDLFDDGILTNRLANADVVLCNPPFEIFNQQERARYKEVSAISGARAEAVLKLALQSAPSALGFVLPRAFLLDRAYREQRRAIERMYREVELVSLPDGVFQVSQVESALVIARDKRTSAAPQVLRASEVDDADRRVFALTGKVSRTREELRSQSSEDGAIWIPPLGPLWKQLAGNPRLGDLVEGHWGIRWLDQRQSTAGSDKPGPKRALGVLRATDNQQFMLGRTTWLDVNPGHLYAGGNLPWSRPKILCNAARLSRGYWRLAAIADRQGLVASQQYAGLWPLDVSVNIDALVAILNGPLANAYMADHSTEKRFRIGTLLNIPLPTRMPPELGELVRKYTSVISENTLFQSTDYLSSLLDRIDESILEAYGLAPRQTRALLAMFGSTRRPVAHDWTPWNVSLNDPALTLGEIRDGLPSRAQGAWPRERLGFVPSREASAAAPYLP